MISDDDILGLWKQREGDMGVVFQRMREVMNAYNGDTIVAIPSMDQSKKRVVANLLKQTLDKSVQRITGVDPMMDWAAIRPHIARSVDLANDRKMAVHGWWEANAIPKKLKRRARHLIGYSSSPVIISPDSKLGIPKWHVRNPMTSFPAQTSDPDDLTPENVIFAYPKPMGWLQRAYPLAYDSIANNQTKRSDMVQVIEYDDCDETVLLVVGKPSSDLWSTAFNGHNNTPRVARLECYPNKAGVPRVIIPGRITLDRPMGQFDGLLPLAELEAKMMALEVIAVERGIFPDFYLEGFPNSGQTPALVSGDWKEGSTGEINVITGGSAKTLSMNPGVYTTQIVDRLHAAQMDEGSAPSQFSGQAPSTIRTNAAGQSTMSAMIDPGISENQKILEYSLEAENKVAVAVAKAWFGGASKTFYVSSKFARGNITYVPNQIFETDQNTVSYPLAGTDQQNLTIAVESLAGSSMLSLKTARWLHPMIDDPDGEEVQISVEALEKAGLAMITQQAEQGQMPWDIYVDMVKAVRAKQMTIEEAMNFADKEEKKRQATAAQTPPPQGTPGQPPGPEGQPGAGPPGTPPVGAPPQGLANVGQLGQILGGLQRAGGR